MDSLNSCSLASFSQQSASNCAPLPSLESKPPAEQSRSPGWQRFWGTAKLLGGGLEVAAGVAGGSASSWSGIGAAAGAGVALHGSDTVISALRQLWSGRDTSSLTSQGVSLLSGSTAAGEIADAGLGLAGTVGVGAFTKVLEGEELAAKTVTWTASLPPGSGMTGPFGDIIASRLGTALDRAQVLFHEKVHSFLSPGAFDFLAGPRASIRTFLYSRSNVMRYAEEAIAESAAQLATRETTGQSTMQAIKTGLAFPLENDYVTAKDLAIESAGVAGKAVDFEHQTVASVSP
jgi:hypothetical protein